MLTDAQVVRLSMESQILRRELPQFRLYYDRYSSPYASGWVTTTVERNSYEFELELGEMYPDEQPELYVTYPLILRGYWGHMNINQREASHNFHTCDNGPSGCVQICYDNGWNAAKTCVGVLLKGILWLEMYEAYLRDGKSIAQHCGQ